MIKINVKLFTTLRDIAGERIVELMIKDNSTIEDVINILSNIYGRNFKKYINKNIYIDRNMISGYLIFLLNGIHVNIKEGIKTVLKDGDTLSVIPPTSGG